MSLEKLVQAAVDEASTGRLLLIVVATLAFSVAALWLLAARYKPRIIMRLSRSKGHYELLANRAVATVIPIAVVFLFVLFPLYFAFRISPQENGQQVRSAFTAMAEGVERIELWSEHPRPRRATIVDRETLDNFSAQIIQGAPSYPRGHRQYAACNAKVFTRSGRTIHLSVDYYPTHAEGVLFNFKYLLDFRNDSIGELFAEVLGFEMR